MITVETLLGAKYGAKKRPRTPLQWVEAIRNGIPASSVDALAKTLRLTQSELAAALGIPDRTLARRKAEGVLNSDESAKFVRLARVRAASSPLCDDSRGDSELREDGSDHRRRTARRLA
jgi:putative toxin-antitoxin system antitoxin component (TIGR02293 family)